MSRKPPRPPVLLVRANATADIGLGHLMRCAAVAQAWAADGGIAAFHLGTDLRDAEQVLGLEAFAVSRSLEAAGSKEDILRTLEAAGACGADCVLLDGYDFGPAFHAAVKARGLRLGIVDDLGFRQPCVADVVINANIHAARTAYPEDPRGDTRWLLGPAHAMLRPQFHAWRDRRRAPTPRARRLLITLGGSDPDNVTGKILRGLNKREDLEVVVLIGAASPHDREVRAVAEARGAIVRGHVRDMASLLAETDAVISAAGSTALELAYMGVPASLVQIAPNQAGIGEGFAEHGTAIYLGDAARLSAERLNEAAGAITDDAALRERMSAAGRRLVDGRGPERIVDALRSGL